VAIAKARDLAAIQMNLASPIVDEDEIVPRAVHFCKAQHDTRLTHSGAKANGYGSGDL